MNMKINISINENCELIATINSTKSKIISFTPYFFTGSSSFTVQNHIKKINEFLIERINPMISKIFNIPQLKFNKDYLKDPQIKTFRGFLQISADPKEPFN